MRLLLAALVAAFSWPVLADEDRMREHVEWIVEHSDLEYNGEPLPLIFPEPQRGLQMMFYGAQAVLDADARADTILATLDAVYDHNSDVILYRDDLPAEKMDAMLVHELVHYLQDLNGVMAAAECLAETERQAYSLQRKWQDAHDDPNERPDGFTVLLLSMCPRDFY